MPSGTFPDPRLEVHFATLRAPSLKDVLKRSAGNWQMYAAVTGSAMAMATGASAAIIGAAMADAPPEPFARVTAARPLPASSGNMPLMKAQANAANPAVAPTIRGGGVVPIFGSANTIQPGEWISVYGANLASGTATWNGDFPVSLGGASVTINGKAAYLMYVSPDQINLQAPDDVTLGTVSVVVTTAAGSATSIVTLSQFAPSFSLLETTKDGSGYVAGIILRSDGSGTHGGGAYDILGPTGNFFGYPTVAAKAGDIVELFGVGFGPTTPDVPAGAAFTGAASVNNPVDLYINDLIVQPSFVGLSSAGLYQINLTVPSGLGAGPVPIQCFAGGVQTQAKVLFSLQGSGGGTYPVGGGPTGTVGPTFPFTGTSSWGGSSGGGGSGGGTGSVHRKKQPRYEPRMQFPPK
jgi:uncharacterized protein (TIGR03437 family)